MMEVESGYKLVEFGKEKGNEARKRLCKSAEEREKVQSQLMKPVKKKTKRQSLVNNLLEIVYDHVCCTVVNIAELLLI